jgi:hypothetical protein
VSGAGPAEIEAQAGPGARHPQPHRLPLQSRGAGRIVDALSEPTFAVIDDDSVRLTAGPAIGPVRADRIAAT